MTLVPVLVRPRYAGNIGAVMRAALNFGLRQVILVQPQADLADLELVRMAMGAQREVELATYPSLEGALAPFSLAVGFTSLRERDPRGVVSAWELPPLLAAHNGPVAFVFGPERGGLSRQELDLCSHLASIPTNPAFPVMNLAQAAAVALAIAGQGQFSLPQPRSAEDFPAPREEVEKALHHLREVLLASKFLDPNNPDRVFRQIRHLLGRGLPTGRELKILHALAAHVAYLTQKAQSPSEKA